MKSSTYAYLPEAFTSVTYVHSHMSFFSRFPQAFQDENAYLDNISNKIYEETLQQLADVSNYLKQLCPKYQFAMDMLKSNKYSSQVQDMLNTFNDMRRQILESSEIDTTEQLNELKNILIGGEGGETLCGLIGDAVGEALLEDLGKKRKRITKLTQLKDTKEITLEEFRKAINVKMKDNSYKINKTLNSQLQRFDKNGGTKLMNEIFIKMQATIKEYADTLSELTSGLLSSEQQGKLDVLLQKVTKCYNDIQATTLSGNIKEYINLLKYQSLLVSDAALNDEGLIVSTQMVGTGQHQFTSDNMLTILNKSNETLANLGITIKSSLRREGDVIRNDIFDKQTNFTESENNQVVNTINETVFQDPYAVNYLRYLIINYQVLFKFAAGSEEKNVVPKGAKSMEDVNMPDIYNVKYKYPDAYYRLRSSIGMILAIKALLGSAFMDKNFADTNDFKDLSMTKGIPLILDISDNYYWTYEILDIIIKVSKEQGIKQVSKLFTIDRDIGSLNFIQYDELVKLYLAKKITESAGQNRYEEIMQNGVDSEYKEFAANIGVTSAMDTMQKIIVRLTPEKMKNLVLKGTSRFKVPIGDYIGRN